MFVASVGKGAPAKEEKRRGEGGSAVGEGDPLEKEEKRKREERRRRRRNNFSKKENKFGESKSRRGDDGTYAVKVNHADVV